MTVVEICPACGDKFPYSRDKSHCKKCTLPITVALLGDEAVAAWQQQTAENKRLFGRMHARQDRGSRKPAKKQQKHGAETWLARAKAKHKEARKVA